MTLKELREKMDGLHGQARSLLEAAKAEGREITAEESARVDALYDEYDQLKAQADALEAEERADARRRKRAEEAEAYLSSSAGRQTRGNEPHRSGGQTAAGNPNEAVVLQYRGQPVRLEPGTPEHARAGAGYLRAWSAFLTTGVSAGLMVGRDPKGGYLAPVQMAMSLLAALDDQVFMRQLATVLPPLTSAVSLGIPTLDTDPNDATWTPEVPAADLAEDDTMAFGKRELVPHGLSKLVKISRKLLRVAAMDPESIARSRISYKVGITHEKAYLTGTGHQQPLGIFVASDDGIPTSRDVACASQTDVAADDLIECMFNVKGQYMARGSWVTSRDLIKRARKLKTGEGQYLWSPGLAGQPATLLDRPYYMSEYAPNTFTSGLYVAVFGDFKTGYWIVDSLSLAIEVLLELFRLRNQVGLVAESETDGMPVLSECFSRLKMA